MKYETRLTRVSFLLYTPNNLDHTFWKYFQECILSYIHPETHLNLRDYDLIEESGKALWGNSGKKEHRNPFLDNNRASRHSAIFTVLYVVL